MVIKMKKGYLTELVFINSLDGKRFCEINLLLQELMQTLYPKIKVNDLITAYKYGKYAKTDIVISVRGIKKGISIKTGDKNSVHLEPISKFIQCLKKYNFKETESLLRYLYSDGTNNNTGIERISAEEYKKDHQEEIDKINLELDKIKKMLIIRFLIKTDVNYQVSVDAIVYGCANDFIWATKEEVISYLYKKEIESTGVQIGSLFLQNWDKNLKYNPKYEKCREYVQVKWYSLFDDVIFIMCARDKGYSSQQAECVKHKKKNSVIAKFLNNIWSR